MRNKTIFISAFHSFISKNILNTGVLKTLVDKKNLKIVILVPEFKEKFFKDSYEGDNVAVEGVPTSSMASRRNSKFFSVWSHLLIDAHYLEYKRRERLAANRTAWGYLKIFIESVAVMLMSGNRFWHAIFRFLFIKNTPSPEVKDIFNHYKPDVLFSTDIFDETDCLFIAEARRREIGIIGMVRSWDNCYSKGLLRVIPDKIIANNGTIKEELINLHEVLPKDIAVLGSPQHDVFVNTVRSGREEFFTSMNLDPGKKTILFAPAGTILSDTDFDIADILKKALEENQFVLPVQFLVRNHPGHPANFSSMPSIEDMVIENPGKIFNINNPKETELTLKDNEHLADELFYSDIVVWVATTLPIDAVIFDKPLIAVNFDGYRNKPYYESVRRYHDEDHMKKMLDLGGVSIVNSKKELIDAINSYLKDPSLHTQQRENIRKQQLHKLDGRAGERIGREVLEFISA